MRSSSNGFVNNIIGCVARRRMFSTGARRASEHIPWSWSASESESIGNCGTSDEAYLQVFTWYTAGTRKRNSRAAPSSSATCRSIAWLFLRKRRFSASLNACIVLYLCTRRATGGKERGIVRVTFEAPPKSQLRPAAKSRSFQNATPWQMLDHMCAVVVRACVVHSAGSQGEAASCSGARAAWEWPCYPFRRLLCCSPAHDGYCGGTRGGQCTGNSSAVWMCRVSKCAGCFARGPKCTRDS